ncbi:DUF2264 domain-containing protein [Streptomyces sp. NPDC050610]|uniref:DUF2264 domain-containing protein n=1 Tax=Streptomyces sp. NPDC050610 TaxID=3157097 RepID=UPI00344209ED
MSRSPEPPPRLLLPPEDRLRSPRTGWTRDHWEAVADHLLDALLPYMSPYGAAVHPPGPPSWSGRRVDGLEGFARSFLLVAIRLAGARGADPSNRAERWARGLIAGARPNGPDGPEAWPGIADGSQQIVEAAGIALSLHLSKPWLWDRLAPCEQERVAHWLTGVAGRRTRDNNHVLFQVVVEEFLSSIGALADRTGIEAGLARVDEWYRGDGWYQDGPRRRTDYRDPADGKIRSQSGAGYDAGERFDYYNAWGFHLYTLLWAHIAGAGGEKRAAVYRERLRSFLTQYVHLFGADGAPVHHGRSLPYRFAALAPVWLGAWAAPVEDAEPPLSPGLTRRLASATLRHFVRRGAPDPRGLLPLGWYAEFSPGTQAYSGPGAPYAASKGFLGLLLPPEHPVWTAVESRLPIEDGDCVRPLPTPGFLIHGTRKDGVVRLLNHGSHYLTAPPATHRDDPHYAKFAYSSCTGPEVGEAAHERLDNHIALVSPTGDISRRERIHRVAVADGYAASWHRPRFDEAALSDGDDACRGFFDDCRIDSVSVVCGRWEIRVHRVVAPVGWTVREGGYALADRTRPAARTTPARGTPGRTASAARSAGVRAAVRRADGLVSAVVGLHSWTAGGVRHSAGTNAFGRCSAVPYVSGPTGPTGEAVYVSAILLGEYTDRDGGALDAVFPRGISVTVDGRTVRLQSQPGQRRLLVRPGASNPVVTDCATAYGDGSRPEHGGQ